MAEDWARLQLGMHLQFGVLRYCMLLCDNTIHFRQVANSLDMTAISIKPFKVVHLSQLQETTEFCTCNSEFFNKSKGALNFPDLLECTVTSGLQ